ncbi:serpentine type 7TM GPCR chemoreceptor srt domain-containing protein [Ditylenchus destructor]|uniref:Serpentine type 7TM GPCR chemoreceptor srt domain-containing protein n=1 Tax=Ditylenchus destructor TaxID=166010 RepID=A0AAD4MP38_9BILA|nr:serpentine type 7TM GPCR chemoreceptor srt domain-containing protein [Ditylenchus destructor]
MKRCPTCYSFMLYLGIVDTVGLLLTAFVCGIMSIKGIVYCQMPLFTFVYCNVGMFGWFACNTTTLLLAINRCMVLYDDDLADRLFKGQRGTMWLIIPTTAGLLGMWLSPPVVYNPIDSSAILNPHRHYLADEPFFHGRAHLIYNWFIVLAIPIIYITFAVFFANRLRTGGITAFSGNRKRTRELNTFLQVLVTSVFVVSTSLGFIYQGYLQNFPIFVFVGYILYQGSPAFIYICMNQSIRNTLLAKSTKVYATSRMFASNIPPVSRTEANTEK